MFSLTSGIVWILGVIGVLGCVIVVGMLIFQRRFIYVPYFPPGSRSRVDTPDQWGMSNWENVHLHSADGTLLHAYWIGFEAPGSASKARATVLFCHANAGNMGHRLGTIALMRQALQCNVLIFSYRGYGLSANVEPTEKGLKADAEAAFQWLLQRNTEKLPIALYGQSIGGAVAIWLAYRFPESIQLLAVENSFTSVPALVPVHFPWLAPFARFCTERWESSLYLEKMLRLRSAGAKVPFVLLLAGEKDEVVPTHQMLKLAEICKREGAKFKLCLFVQGRHNDTWMQNGYFDAFPAVAYSD